MAKNWFSVHTKVRKEQLALAHFIQQGYECYLPLASVIYRHARKRERNVRPFFPGYLFLRLENNQQQWTSIRSTIGAIGAVHFGPHYPTVSQQIIDSLRAQEDESGLIQIDETSVFKPGDKVSILSGPFDGLSGLFKTSRGEDRALILLNMMKREVAATMPLVDLQAV